MLDKGEGGYARLLKALVGRRKRVRCKKKEKMKKEAKLTTI